MKSLCLAPVAALAALLLLPACNSSRQQPKLTINAPENLVNGIVVFDLGTAKPGVYGLRVSLPKEGGVQIDSINPAERLKIFLFYYVKGPTGQSWAVANLWKIENASDRVPRNISFANFPSDAMYLNGKKIQISAGRFFTITDWYKDITPDSLIRELESGL